MEDDKKNSILKQSVHEVLAHSYSLHLFLFLVGVVLDLIFGFKVFVNPVAVYFGFLFLFLGSLLIVWAQKTSRNLKKENITKESFGKGPYRYTRTPTNFGLFFMVLGFGIISNALFIILSAFTSLLIAKFIFLRKEEEILAKKYGAPYLEYKKFVRF